MNKIAPNSVFMSGGERLLAEEAILSGASAVERGKNEASNAERRQSESTDEALAGMVRDHSRLVYRIAYAALRQHQDAEDATQETFLRVLRYRSKLVNVEDPKTWLARIAWRVAVDRSKRRRVNEISIEDEGGTPDLASGETVADAKLEGAQFGAVLEKMIQALPNKLRQPLILSTIEEMPPRQVAEILGMNENAVRSRIFRAKKILKEKLLQRMGTRG
jgi:RNA polymerase sigma-70 factor, ECF subfamily